MTKKIQWTEVQKVNLLGKGLLLSVKGNWKAPRGKAKRPRFDRRKEEA